MKKEHLNALVIDRHFGELSAEVAALLDAYLASHPEAQAEAAHVIESLDLTGRTLTQHPELVRLEEPEPVVRAPMMLAPKGPMWARAAAVALFAALAATGGFYAGSNRSPEASFSKNTEIMSPTPHGKPSPWTRYRMTADPVGGMQVVRVTHSQAMEEIIQ